MDSLKKREVVKNKKMIQKILKSHLIKKIFIRRESNNKNQALARRDICSKSKVP